MEGKSDYTVREVWILARTAGTDSSAAVGFGSAIRSAAAFSANAWFGGFLKLLLLASLTGLLFLQFRRRIHAAAALLAPAVARSFVVTIVKPVIVGKFLADLYVANGLDEYPPLPIPKR
jgi:hypothetical protein